MSDRYKRNSRGVFETRIWDGTYTASGKKHRRRIISYRSSEDLEHLVYMFKHYQTDGDHAIDIRQSFYDYALTWCETEKSCCEKNTKRMYRTTINYLSDLSRIPVREIQHSHLQTIINQNMAHPKTCKNIKSVFSQILRSAVRDHLLPRDAIQDIMEDINMPHYVKKERRTLTALEREAIMKVHLDPQKEAFLFILYYCGLRRQEALALTPDCFDWEKNTLTVRRVMIFVNNDAEIKEYPKSDHGLRTIPMADALTERIRPFVESCQGEYLFHTKYRTLMSETGYRRMWQSIVTALNVAVGYNPCARKNRTEPPIQGLTAHIFRHNFCSELCYQIPDISTLMIAKLLGDNETMVREVYSHILMERENVTDALNRAFGPANKRNTERE